MSLFSTHLKVAHMPASSQINFRVSRELKETIENVAKVLGLSVSEFIASTVVREARQVLQESQVTRLSNRDRDVFLKMLGNVDRKPNAALVAAVSCYRTLRQSLSPPPTTLAQLLERRIIKCRTPSEYLSATQFPPDPRLRFDLSCRQVSSQSRPLCTRGGRSR